MSHAAINCDRVANHIIPGLACQKNCRARHILIRLKEGMSDADARDRLARLRGRIVAGHDFAEPAKVHSDDGSGPPRRQPGWVPPGQPLGEWRPGGRDGAPLGEAGHVNVAGGDALGDGRFGGD